MAKRFPEVSIEVEGKPYTLVLDINAMRALEDLMSTDTVDVSFHHVVAKAVNGSMRSLTALMWAALRRHHRDMTLDQVGDWIGEVNESDLASRVTHLVNTTVPDEKDVKAAGVKPRRPRRAQGD